MNKKTFLIIRVATAIILAMAVSIGITLGNYLLPIIAFIAVIVILLAAKHKVKDVLADERDYKIAGQAAKATMNIYNLTMALLGAVMMALSKIHSDFIFPAEIILYSVCVQMILYTILFKIYSRYGDYEK
jgi:uncharacterized membrane protein